MSVMERVTERKLVGGLWHYKRRNDNISSHEVNQF